MSRNTVYLVYKYAIHPGKEYIVDGSECVWSEGDGGGDEKELPGVATSQRECRETPRTLPPCVLRMTFILVAKAVKQ